MTVSKNKGGGEQENPARQRWIERNEILGHFDFPVGMVDKRMKLGKRLFLDEFVRLELWKLDGFLNPDDGFEFLLEELSLLLCGTYENEHYDCHPLPDGGLMEMYESRVNASTKKLLTFILDMLENGNVEGVIRYLRNTLKKLEK